MLIACQRFRSAQEQRIRVGFSAMSGSMAWLWTAKEGGYFDQHGLKVDLVYVGGTAQLFQSMLAGEIAFGIGGGPAIIHANLQRRSIVGVAGSLNRMVMKIMATPQIKTAADIRGKRIAITRYGTTTDFSARLFLEELGPRGGKGGGDSSSRQYSQRPCLIEQRDQPARRAVAAGASAG